MTRRPYDTDSVLDTAMQVIQDEHRYFTSDGIGNEEHIPRIVRIAESAGKLLKVGGMPKHEVEANIQRIIHYGRQLFIDEWMKPLPGDTDLPDEEEAIEEFDQCVKNTRRAKK
jgi:hypothetical protein